MTNDELLEAITLAKAGDISARNAIVEDCLPMISIAASKLARRVRYRLEPGEFVSAAALAFDQIIRAFDPARGIKFQTFAAYRTHGAMIDFLRSIDPGSRLVRERTAKRDGFSDAFYAEHGHRPTPEEEQAALAVRDQSFAALNHPDPSRARSLNTMLAASDFTRDLYLGDMLPDRTDEQAVATVMTRDIVKHVLDTRGLRAALLLKLRFIDGWLLTEIGTAFTDLGFTGTRQGRRGDGKTLSSTRMSQAIGELVRDLREEFAEAA